MNEKLSPEGNQKRNREMMADKNSMWGWFHTWFYAWNKTQECQEMKSQNLIFEINILKFEEYVQREWQSDLWRLFWAQVVSVASSWCWEL